jgi:hypothetical protein
VSDKESNETYFQQASWLENNLKWPSTRARGYFVLTQILEMPEFSLTLAGKDSTPSSPLSYLLHLQVEGPKKN